MAIREVPLSCIHGMLPGECEVCLRDVEIAALRGLFCQVFDLLIDVRKVDDRDALQDAIDIAAIGSCKTMDF